MDKFKNMRSSDLYQQSIISLEPITGVIFYYFTISILGYSFTLSTLSLYHIYYNNNEWADWEELIGKQTSITKPIV